MPTRGSAPPFLKTGFGGVQRVREENAAAPPELAACILSHVTLNNASYPDPAGGAISAVGACFCPAGLQTLVQSVRRTLYLPSHVTVKLKTGDIV